VDIRRKGDWLHEIWFYLKWTNLRKRCILLVVIAIDKAFVPDVH